MYALILSLCMVPVINGQEAEQDTCEEAVIAEYKSIRECTKYLHKHVDEIARGPFAPFDWQVSCEYKKSRK